MGWIIYENRLSRRDGADQTNLIGFSLLCQFCKIPYGLRDIRVLVWRDRRFVVSFARALQRSSPCNLRLGCLKIWESSDCNSRCWLWRLLIRVFISYCEGRQIITFINLCENLQIVTFWKSSDCNFHHRCLMGIGYLLWFLDSLQKPISGSLRYSKIQRSKLSWVYSYLYEI